MAISLLGQQHSLDVGQNAALSDGDFTEQLIELLLLIIDGQLQVGRNDPRLVVAGRAARQLQNLGRQVHGGPDTDPFGVVALTEQPVYAAYWELQTSWGRSSFSFSPNLAYLFTTSKRNYLIQFNNKHCEQKEKTLDDM